MNTANFTGDLAVLAAVALIADLAIERRSPQTKVPAINGSQSVGVGVGVGVVGA